MRFIVLSLCISAVCCTALAEQAPAKRALTPDDMYAIKAAGDPQVSPDGKLVAYTVRSADREQNKWHTEIWIAALDGSRAPWQFTTTDSSSSPRWSPDGRTLAFLSARRDPKTGAVERVQIYTLSLNGGDARRLTNLKNGVTAFDWSPDGSQLACISKIGPRDSLPPGKKPSDELDYVHPIIKFDGVGYLNDQRSHIWVVNAASGDAKQITFGDQQNDSNPQWSPDGAQIAYVDNRTDGKSIVGGEGIYLVPAAGGTPRKLSNIDIGISSVRWSPKGDRIAYVGSVDRVAIPKIFVAPASGGNSVLVSNDVTYASNLRWSSDGNAIYYLAPYEGNEPIFRINLDTKKVSQLTSNTTTRIMTLDPATGILAFVSSDDTNPGNVFTANPNGGDLRQLTHLNAKLLSGIDVQPSEPIEYTSVDGWKIQGFFTKPLNWQPGKTYPMILMVHGGPNGMWSANLNQTVQCYAAHGWAVLRINPRGSSGYGEKFQRGVFREFGGKAYQDLMNGVDYTLAQNKWIDPNRLGVVGHSYGGFMTGWIIGHTTRFKAAIPEDGMADFVSDDGTRDAFYGHERDFGADFFKDRQVFVANSPFNYADKVKTPALFLEGGADMRVPVGQVEEYFRAISHFGIPTELVIFPGEPHTTSRTPNHVVDWVKWEIYWFERWLDNNPNAVKPNAIK